MESIVFMQYRQKVTASKFAVCRACRVQTGIDTQDMIEAVLLLEEYEKLSRTSSFSLLSERVPSNVELGEN